MLFRSSQSNIERVGRLIANGQMAPAGLRVVDEAKAAGKWVAAQLSLPLTMHPAFEDALRKNKRAAAFYESLAPGYQRQYRDWIATAKRDDTRTRRIAQAIKQLAAGKKAAI